MKLWFQTQNIVFVKVHTSRLHYAQNKYLKKDLYKAQNAYNVLPRGGEGGYVVSAWWELGTSGEKDEVKGPKGQCAAVPHLMSHRFL